MPTKPNTDRIIPMATPIGVLLTNGCKLFRNVLYSLKRKLGEGKMSGFIPIKCNDYEIIVQPSDRFRRSLAEFGLGGLVPYFNATNLYFDMRIYVSKQKPEFEDSIKYEWLLCDENCRRIPNAENGVFRFFNSLGDGTFNISNIKSKSEILKKEGILHGSNNKQIIFRKLSVMKIGYIPKSDQYNIVMRCTSAKTGTTSDYQLAVIFNLFNKDRVRYAFLISLAGIIIATIVGVVLRLYGITP